MKDYYQILEIAPDASPNSIKEQYLFLVQAWHPDKFPNSAQKLKAEEKLKDINEAYETLRNPTKRADYDNRIRHTRSSYQQEHREQTSQREWEDVNRRKEEAARRAKETRSRKEKETREREVLEKRRKDEALRQRIHRLDQEIMAVNQDINRLSNELPKMPTAIFAILFFVGGIYIPTIGAYEDTGLFLFLGGASIIIGIILFRKRNEFFIENYKPKLDEVERCKQRLKQLTRERNYLK